jgi:hypothetical protein
MPCRSSPPVDVAYDCAFRWSDVLSWTWSSAATLSVARMCGVDTMSVSSDIVDASRKKPIPGMVVVPRALSRKPGTGIDAPRMPRTSA